MRVLLPLLLIVVLSGCGSPDPVAEPVAEKKSEPQPVAPKAEAQPVAAQPEQPKNKPAPDAAGPQQAPANPPANPQPAQPPVAEKPQQPVASNRAPGKVPLLVSVRTKAGKKHVGELIERTDAGLVVYDIVLRDTVSITKDQVQSFVEGIDERTASSHVPFATYAAWKLTKLLRIGTVQGRIALASDQGIFINLGSAHGLLAGQPVTLLGKAVEITDPETGEQLAVYRPPVATLRILDVVNERLSRLSITASDKSVKFEQGMTVSCERGSTTIVVIPPQWKSEDPNLKTGDEALYLTEHVLTELVRYRLSVISRDQSDQIRDELANKTGQPNETVSPISIAEELRAGVVLTGELLARGQTGNVTLYVTDLATRQYVGILAGRIRRDKIREASTKAKKAADDIKKQVGSLPAEMARRKKIATQLIEAGVRVVLKLPNGTFVAYHNKQLPDPDVGFPPVFAFQDVMFSDGNAHLSALLAGLYITTLQYWLSDSRPEYFSALEQDNTISLIQIRAPAEPDHISRLPFGVKHLVLGRSSRLSAKWLAYQTLPHLQTLQAGGGLQASEFPAITRRLRIDQIGVQAPQMTKGWTKFLTLPITKVSVDLYESTLADEFDLINTGLQELRGSTFFKTRMRGCSLWGRGTGNTDSSQLFTERFLTTLLLSPADRPMALRFLFIQQLDLSPEFTRRIRLSYPTVNIIAK
jgi:TolB-like protein